MDRQRLRQLAARFIAEAEADIRYGLAEDLDPRREYERLVERLHDEDDPRAAPAASSRPAARPEDEAQPAGAVASRRGGLSTHVSPL